MELNAAHNMYQCIMYEKGKEGVWEREINGKSEYLLSSRLEEKKKIVIERKIITVFGVLVILEFFSKRGKKNQVIF